VGEVDAFLDSDHKKSVRTDQAPWNLQYSVPFSTTGSDDYRQRSL